MKCPATDEARRHRKLKRDKQWQPCPVETGDQHFANGIFHFNISRALAFLDANPDRFPIELISVATIPDYGSKTLDETTVQNADLTRPILFAEISPGRYSVIDGHHRVARARRDGVTTLPARKLPCPDHLAFLISAQGYDSYIDYWNSKLDDLLPTRPRRRGNATRSNTPLNLHR